MRKHLRQIGGRYSLKEMPRTYDCEFLEGKKCTIYPVRPTQCHTFPWWPHLVDSKESWQQAAACCEGIQPDAPLVAAEEIEQQLEIYDQKHPHDER